MNIKEAKQMCKDDSNYFIAWTFDDCDDSWATKKEAVDYRNKTIKYPKGYDIEKLLPVYRCLCAKSMGWEENVQVCRIF